MSCVGTKFRYIIHGVPKNKKYTIEEAQWCDESQQFIYEQVHTVSAAVVKQWLGYIPSTIGDIKTIMWMVFPDKVFNPATKNPSSPLSLLEKNRDVFMLYNLERFRFFPQGTCQEQAAQISR
jgi:hypothetical protein